MSLKSESSKDSTLVDSDLDYFEDDIENLDLKH
jgi:hypothetical protein